MEKDSINLGKISKDNRKFKYVFVTLFIILLISSFVSLFIGRYPISLIETINLLIQNDNLYSTEVNIILYLRIPRVIMAIIVGASLSLSGSVYQSTFNNKLISPDILGVSSGACVGAAFAIIMGFNIWICSFMSFVTGLISVCITLIIPKIIRNNSSLALVLSGIIVSAIMNSILGLIKFLADSEGVLASITFWTMGDLSNSKYENIVYILPIVIISILILMLIRWKINIVSLGEIEAQSLGVNYKRYRTIIVICSTLLTAASVSVCGSIGWIGLVIPHITKLLVGNDNRKALPICMIIGSIFMVWVDGLARTLSINEIPLSIITGILGASIYLVLLVKKGRNIV